MSETIVDFYRDRTVFLTGGTGFLGKVLLEKLLRSCPQIGRIYLLIRPGTSDGKSPQLRLKQLLAERVFRFNCSQLDLSKVWPIGGDITKPNLAISDNDRRLLIDSVSIVIHSAANVRFTGPLNSFVRQNALGTDNVMAFASQITNLKVRQPEAISNSELSDSTGNSSCVHCIFKLPPERGGGKSVSTEDPDTNLDRGNLWREFQGHSSCWSSPTAGQTEWLHSEQGNRGENRGGEVFPSSGGHLSALHCGPRLL